MATGSTRPGFFKVVQTIGWVTFLEIVRDKILYTFVMLAFLLLGIGLLASKLTFVRPDRVILDFGMTAVQLSCVMVAIFTGASAIGREFERRTFFVSLSRPISRFNFIVGKYAGLALLQIANWALLSLSYVLILTAVGAGFGHWLSSSFLWALVLVLSEALLMTAAALMLSTFTTTSIAAMLSVGLYLVGTNISQIRLISARTKNPFASEMLNVLANVLPNLENFHLGFKVTYDLPTPFLFGAGNLMYGAVFSAYLVILAGIIIYSRES